ncbi:MAG: AAA family ATPase [Clostridium sp.]|nr:MAG: AAA family ATPase [Clostridium sp.]
MIQCCSIKVSFVICLVMPTISFVEVILGLARENNIDLYVADSNSKMLSSDIVTEFRDKATNISIRPLSFEEFFYLKVVRKMMLYMNI